MKKMILMKNLKRMKDFMEKTTMMMTREIIIQIEINYNFPKRNYLNIERGQMNYY